ncbi:uncharacterized protein LOC113562191 isoform X2 [Ooceraea biroi]|uniref:uncharacterized protein LOC113562191 isoform X2 n=1 Tax=Ooceraea biroi TaxID=2015173 RepID=UPI000F0904BB|nr:uncharacterized protein LOC113562191 isoform X2 [Ooceraea biroi]
MGNGHSKTDRNCPARRGNGMTPGSSRPDCVKNKTSTMSNLVRDQLGQRGTGDVVCAGLVRGLDHIRNPQLNKVGYLYAYRSQSLESDVTYINTCDNK